MNSVTEQAVWDLVVAPVTAVGWSVVYAGVRLADQLSGLAEVGRTPAVVVWLGKPVVWTAVADRYQALGSAADWELLLSAAVSGSV